MDEREDPGDGEKLEERVEALTEELVDAIIDLEEYAQRGERPPLARGYRFKVNGLSFVWDKPIILGREVLEKAGLLPPANYTLRLKLTGEAPRRIELDELVDLRRSGSRSFVRSARSNRKAKIRAGASRRSSTRTVSSSKAMAFAGRPLSTVRPGS
jgi:hypothetical protein